MFLKRIYVFPCTLLISGYNETIYLQLQYQVNIYLRYDRIILSSLGGFN